MQYRPPNFIQRLRKVAVPLPVVLIVALLSTTLGVYAASGTTDSSAAPGATNSYTLEDIYARLNNTYTGSGRKTHFPNPPWRQGWHNAYPERYLYFA